MEGRQPFPSPVDVLIVGSGPIGATYARLLVDQRPDLKILMVDLGPQLTERPGVNVKNIPDRSEQIQAEVRSQGPVDYPYVPMVQDKSDAGPMTGPGSLSTLARPGTHLVNSDALGSPNVEMPAAAMSSNVGGMGVHWAGACPRPGKVERPGFISEGEFEDALARAEQLLHVTTDAFPESAQGRAILRTLSDIFDPRLPEGRKVQRMPMACQVTPDGRRVWTGADAILGPLAERARRNFELRPETICKRVFAEGGRVTGALLQHRPSGREETVASRAVVVAADALRTPQLLWASGIRPPALAHYLNEHQVVMCAITPPADFATRTDHGPSSNARPVRLSPYDPIVDAFWVPFSVPGHPYHAQVMYLDLSPAAQDRSAPAEPHFIIASGWSGPKESRYEDFIEFSDAETDFFGMPTMTIHFRLSERDLKTLEGAKREQAKAAAALGTFDEQQPAPPGSSLHYLGTVRMGAEDDGQSVCDSYSRVWGFQNLFVGGNGVIPTELSCNPTLTSVALAVRASAAVARLLS